MSKVIYNAINELAFSSFHNQVSKENYDEWIIHWFQTIVNLKEEYKNNNLTQTADALNVIFNEQLDILSRREYDLVKASLEKPQDLHQVNQM